MAPTVREMVPTPVGSPRPELESHQSHGQRDETWFEAAACREADLRLFFDPEGEGAKPRAERERAAKAVCSWCPVRRECLIFALATPERYGIWGGLTARERSSLRRRRHVARRGDSRKPKAERRGP